MPLVSIFFFAFNRIERTKTDKIANKCNFLFETFKITTILIKKNRIENNLIGMCQCRSI